MLGLLLLLFVVVPVVELYFIVQVAGSIGALETIALLIVISVVGTWLAKVAGFGVLNRFRRTVAQGKVPSAELVDGALVLAAGALMILPGFVSDIVAIVLLLPPTRIPIRRLILRRIRAGGGIVTVVAGRGRGPGRGDVWDVDSWEDPPSPPDRPTLGP